VKVTVVGASGLIGRRLCDALAARGDEVRAVSRGGATGIARARDVRWDPAEGPPPAEALDGADAVVNLAGAPLAGRRWTAARKRLIRESRASTTRLLVEALGAADRPRVLVNGSAVGYYGPREEVVDEDAPPGSDFLAETCVAWEREAARARERGVRVVLVRTGIVLAREGGALPRLALPVRLLAGGPIGGGRQWIPWIHIDDEVGLILLALDRDDLSGPLNAVAPRPVRQRELVRALGRVLARPTLLPAPAVAVRLALGEMATVVLDGQHAIPRVAQEAGHEWAFPDLEAALGDLLSGR
jgi:uncharacterized protein (TIGR01777 family)